MKLRFHLDEHMAAGIATALRQHGVDVTTTPEAGLLGTSDEVQLAYARSSGAVPITPALPSPGPQAGLSATSSAAS